MPYSLKKLLFSDPTTALIKRSMQAQLKRAEVISSNLANVETPKYQRVDIDFKTALRQASSGEKTIRLETTHPRHIRPVNSEEEKFEIRIDHTKSQRVDGNNVDLDKEMSNLAETQLMYEAAILMLQKKGALVRNVIDRSKI